VHKTSINSFVPFQPGCGKVEADTFSKTIPTFKTGTIRMHATKTETRTGKSSLYSISSGVGANDFIT
jgi:hypothetical protein